MSTSSRGHHSEERIVYDMASCIVLKVGSCLEIIQPYNRLDSVTCHLDGMAYDNCPSEGSYGSSKHYFSLWILNPKVSKHLGHLVQC